jgi:hypothetical protein
VTGRHPTRAELIAWAAPPCPTCGAPIARTETRYEATAYTVPPGPEGYRTGPTYVVCVNEHRTLFYTPPDGDPR